MPKVPVGAIPSDYIAHDRAARNGVVADAEQVRKLAGRCNTIAGRRFKRLWHKAIPGQDAYSAAGSATTWRGLFHTSPNVKNVRVHMIIRGSESVGTDHYYEWTVGGVAQERRRIAIDATTLADAYFMDTLRYDRQRFVDGSGDPLAGNTQYEFSLTVNDGCRIVAASIYEERQTLLDTDVHTAVLVDPLAVGSPVLSREIADLHAAAWHLWQKQGPTQVAWSNEDVTPPTQTGTTYKNVIDASTAGYASTAAGQWFYGDGHGSFASATVPCLFWVYASTDAGSNGRVRFTGSGGTLATITGIGTTPQIYTVAADISAINTLAVIEHSNSNAGQTTTTYAAGFYELGT